MKNEVLDIKLVVFLKKKFNLFTDSWEQAAYFECDL